MPGRVVPVHYLRENARNYSPAAVIFLDTETRVIREGDPEILGLRLWVARYVDRRTPKKVKARHVTSWGTTTLDLGAWVDRMMTGRTSVTLFTHNLGFDLTTTRLPMTLVARGWEVREAAIGGKSPWLRFGKGDKVLTLLDSYSWLPTNLADIGEQVGVRKPKLPRHDDTDAAWLNRCGADVDILATAMLSLMDWWDEHKLGNWSVSGAATGWNAYRHRPTDSQVVIDPTPAVVMKDRDYVHGGRRTVWSLGEHAAGPFYELDFQSAYPTIAAWEPHPVARAYTFDSMPLDDPIFDTPRWDLAARCLIRTDTDRWPIRVKRTTWYPVGEFWADLAGPDIAEARRLGALVAVGAGQAHKVDTNMAPWAQWVLDVQHGRIPGTPPAARIAAKNWGRSTIGKWSSRAFVRERFGPAPGPGWGYEEGWDHDTNSPGGWVDIAGVRWWTHSGGDPENSYPAIHAWVEAAVRVRLGRVIDALGTGCILQANTDGLIVAGRTVGTRAARGHLVAPEGMSPTARLAWVLDCLHPVTAPLLLRVKARAAHVNVLGPQHVTVDAQRRFAGLDKSLDPVAPGVYAGHTWPGLQWQMAHGNPTGYTRPVTTARVTGPYPSGWITADRRVVPIEAEVTADGENRIVPWHRSRYAAAGMHRADVQHHDLDALI